LGRLLCIVLWRGALGFLLGDALTHSKSPLWIAWPYGILVEIDATGRPSYGRRVALPAGESAACRPGEEIQAFAGANQIIRGFGNPLEPERRVWRGTNGSAGASPYRSWSFLGAASGVVLFRRHIGSTPSLEVCATRPRCETGVNSFPKPQTSLCLVGRRSCGALPTSAHHSNWTLSRSKPRKN
jgi:hypothetical protein